MFIRSLLCGLCGPVSWVQIDNEYIFEQNPEGMLIKSLRGK